MKGKDGVVPPHNMVHTIRFTGPAGHRRTTVTRWQLPTWLRRPSSRKGDTSVSIPRVYDYWTVRGPRGSHAGTIGGELLDSSRGHPTMAGRPPRSRDWAVGRPRPPRYVPCCLHLWRRTQTCPRFLLSLAMVFARFIRKRPLHASNDVEHGFRTCHTAP